MFDNDVIDLAKLEDDIVFGIPDDALERATLTNGQAWTWNYCTYNYYQCGPIGGRS